MEKTTQQNYQIVLAAIEKLTNQAETTAGYLKELLLIIDNARIIPKEFLHRGIETLKDYEALQNELCTELNNIIPDCLENDLKKIKEIIIEKASQSEEIVRVKSALQDFLCLSTKHESGSRVLLEVKTEVQKLLNSLSDNVNLADYERYVIFSDFAKRNDIPTIEQEHEFALINSFPSPLPILLFNRGFKHAPTAQDSGKNDTDEKKTNEKLDQTENKAPLEDSDDGQVCVNISSDLDIATNNEEVQNTPTIFKIFVEKEGSDFGAKVFLKLFGSHSSSGKFVFNSVLADDQLQVLLRLAWLRVLSITKLKILFSEEQELSDQSIEKLYQHGYLAKIEHVESKLVMFSLSQLGRAIFKTESSKAIFEGSKGRIPLPKTLFTLSSSDTEQEEHNILHYHVLNTVYVNVPKTLVDLDIKEKVKIQYRDFDASEPALNLSYEDGGVKRNIYFCKSTFDESLITLDENNQLVIVYEVFDTTTPKLKENTKARAFALVNPLEENVRWIFVDDNTKLEDFLLASPKSQGENPTEDSGVEPKVTSEKLETSHDDNIADPAISVEKENEPPQSPPDTNKADSLSKDNDIESLLNDKSGSLINKPKKADDVSEAEEPIIDSTSKVETLVTEFEELSSLQMASIMLEQNLDPSTNKSRFMTLLRKLLIEADIDKSEAEMIKQKLVESKFAQALLLSKTLTIDTSDKDYESFYKRLIHATNAPLDDRNYNYESFEDLFKDDQGSAMHLCALLNTLFVHEASSWDFYDLKEVAQNLFNTFEEVFPIEYTPLKRLLNILIDLLDEKQDMFTERAIEAISGETSKNNILEKQREKARSLLKEPLTGEEFLRSFTHYIFGENSEVSRCMSIIANDDRSRQEQVKNFTEYFFIPRERQDPIISEKKTASYVEDKYQLWRNSNNEQGGPKKLFGNLTLNVISSLCVRLQHMNDWLHLISWPQIGTTNVEKLLKGKKLLLDEISISIGSIKESAISGEITIFTKALVSMRNRLEGNKERDFIFGDFLRTGYWRLKDDETPNFDTHIGLVQYYEPWRNVLAHIAASAKPFSEIIKLIKDTKNHFYGDNLGQLQDIHHFMHRFMEEPLPEFNYDADYENARRIFDYDDKFANEIEKAFAEGQIHEYLKETVIQQLEAFKKQLRQQSNFGTFRRFIDALKKKVAEERDKIKAELVAGITNRRGKIKINKSSELAQALVKAEIELEKGNFVVAEEYINQVDDGKLAPMEWTENNVSQYSIFVNGNEYAAIYEAASNIKFKQSNSANIEAAFENFDYKNYTSKNGTNPEILKSMLKPDMFHVKTRCSSLLRSLGFPVNSVFDELPDSADKHKEFLKKWGYLVLKATMDKTPQNMDDYPHPFASLGTQIDEKNIYFFFDRMSPKDLVEIISGFNLKQQCPIVFINWGLSMAERRTLANIFHNIKASQNPFILIDWVLLVYLSLHSKKECFTTLLGCSLGLTTSFKPFIISGSGNVLDEMFIGRKRELDNIQDGNGPVVVYGGRQLGKTALLLRSKSLFNEPTKNKYAYYVDVIDCQDEKTFVDKLVQQMAPILPKDIQIQTIKDLCSCLRDSFNNTWSKILLLIDEADKFLEYLKGADGQYQLLNYLLDFKKETKNKFKFVLAGLHNVCEFARSANSIFGQFGEPLCIQPLGKPDSRKLLSLPLSYLGFSYEGQNLSNLLVNTLFFPGIIHFVGGKIVENLYQSYSLFYNENDNPPYSLKPDQIGMLINKKDLNKQIDSKIMLTLNVDKRYIVLAGSIGLKYYEKPETASAGYLAKDLLEEIKEYRKEWLGITEAECIILLDELVSMGILIKTDDENNRYRLRQRRFLDAIGKDFESIYEEIYVRNEH